MILHVICLWKLSLFQLFSRKTRRRYVQSCNIPVQLLILIAPDANECICKQSTTLIKHCVNLASTSQRAIALKAPLALFSIIVDVMLIFGRSKSGNAKSCSCQWLNSRRKSPRHERSRIAIHDRSTTPVPLETSQLPAWPLVAYILCRVCFHNCN